MSESDDNSELKWFEVEYLTAGYDKVRVEVQAINEDEAEEEARDDSYAGLDYDNYWKELISVDEIPCPSAQPSADEE